MNSLFKLAVGTTTAIVLTASAAFAQDYQSLNARAVSVYESTQVESRALERFADAVREKSGGKVDFRTYAGTSLGNQEEINEMLTTGGVEIAVHGIAPSPRYVGLFLPYAVDGAEHLSRILDSELGEEWNQELADRAGIEMLRVTFRGVRHTLSRVEVDSTDDLVGLRIRAPDIPAIVAAVESYGANPVIMGIGEVYTALATGAIDGMENTLGGFLNYKFQEVAKYVVLTNHGASPVFWLTNGEWLAGLNDDTRTLIVEEMRAATDWADEQNAELASTWRSQLEADGVTFIEADVGAMRANAEDFVKTEGVAAWGEEGFAKINELR